MDLSTALSSVSATFGLARAALDARDDAKLRAAMVDMQQQLFEAMSGAAALATRCYELEKARQEAETRAREAEASLREREAHELRPLRPGAYAYAKRGQEPDANGPWLCQPCYDNGRKVVLRFMPGVGGMTVTRWTCPESGGHTIQNR
jgi:hypothetical protein